MSTDTTIGTPARRRGRGTRIALIAGGVLLALAGFVAALPTLVSMGMFRGTVIGYATEAVNGTVTVGSLEVGWFSGVAVRDVVIDDAAHGTRIEASASVRQGLWALATKGIAGLDATVSASVRTKRMADGTLGIAALAKASPAGPGAPAAESAAPGPLRLPAGLDVTLAVERLEFQVDAADGGREGSLRVAGATARVLGGGRSSVSLKGSSEWQGSAGSFELEAGAEGIVAADGTLSFAKVPADARLRATKVGFMAGGLAIRVDDADVRIASKDLAGEVAVAAAVRASVEGGEPCAVDADLRAARLLSPAGAFVLDLGGVSGTARATGVPAAAFERFVKGTPIVLVRDVGPRIDAMAAFASADGSGLRVEVRSDRVRLLAEGGVDPRSGSADLRTVTLAADIDPVLVGAAGVAVEAPVHVEATLADVHVPAAGPDGAFPADQLAFAADARLDFRGLRVPGPEGQVPLDVTSLRLRAAAKPIGAGIEADVTASAPAGAARPELRVTASLRRGGPLGVHGTVAVASLPTAFVRPFVPASVPVDVVRDIGDAVRSLQLSIGEGDAPAVRMAMESAHADVRIGGTVGRDGSFRSDGEGTVALRGLRPELLQAFGVPVTAPVDVQARIASLGLPAPHAFAPQACAVDADVSVAGAGGGAFPVRIGAEGGQALQVAALRVKVQAPELGREAAVMVDATVDGMPLQVRAAAKGLRALSQEDIESAALDVSVTLASVDPGRAAGQAPALRDVLANVGSGALAVAVTYRGSLRDGRAKATVTRTGVAVEAEAELAREALSVSATARAELAPAGLAALVPAMPCALGAPVRLDATVPPVRLARTSTWEFAPPAAARAVLRMSDLRLERVPGLHAAVQAPLVAVEADATFAPAMAVKAKLLPASLAAVPAGGSAVPVASLRADAEWSAADGASPQAWSADVRLAEVNGPGIEALLDMPPQARGQIGTGGSVHGVARATVAGGVAFELDSRVQLLTAALKGDWTAGALTLADGTIHAVVPASQVLDLLNAAGGAPQPGGDGKVPPPAWKSASALDLQAEIPSLRIVPGKAPVAVVRASTKELRLQPSDGAAIAIEPIQASIDMPGAGRPATIALRTAVSTAGAGGSAPVTVDAQLRDWCRADGTFALDAVRPDGRIEVREASTAVLGALLGRPAELPEALGPTATVLCNIRSTGPGAADGDLAVTSRFLNVSVPRCSLAAGTLAIAPAQPLKVEFIPSPPLRHRLLEPINPVFRDVRLADERKPIVFTVSSLSCPVDGNLGRLDAECDLRVGDVLMDRAEGNAVLDLLKVFQSRDGKPVEGRIDPLRVSVKAGQLTYRDFNVFIERQGDGWVTNLIFSGNIDLSRTPAYARAISANYPMSSVARSVLNVLPSEDGGAVADVLGTLTMGAADAVQLRITFKGPLGDVDGRPAKLERKVKVTFDSKAVEKGLGNAAKDIGQAIGDLFGGGKKDQPKKGGKK